MKNAMMLCAGFGSRLGELSNHWPKPLLPMLNVPILEWGISHLAKSGIENIVINLHHKAELFKESIGDGSRFGVQIQYSFEKEILGTGGGLKKALPLLDPEGKDDPFLSINGKLIFDLDIKKLSQSFDAQSLGMMVVRKVPDALTWGAVDVDESMRVRNILGEGKYMFCGAHVIRPSVVKNFPEGEACTVRQGYLPWIQAGGRVDAFEHKDGYFAEHSIPKRYLQGNIDLLRDQVVSNRPALESYPPLNMGKGATIVEPVFIGQGVSIGDECTVGPNVVLGNNVVVASQSKIKNTVVWADTRVEGDVDQCILTPSSRVDASKE